MLDRKQYKQKILVKLCKLVIVKAEKYILPMKNK